MNDKGLTARTGAYAFVLLEVDRAGIGNVTSAQIGELLNINPTQVRRDLIALGVKGKRGQGYNASIALRKLAKLSIEGAVTALVGVDVLPAHRSDLPYSRLHELMLDLTVTRNLIENELERKLSKWR